MPITRRLFLRSGALAVLTAGLVLRPGALAFGQEKGVHPIPAEAEQDPVFVYTRATFEPYVGGIFITRGVGGTTVELKLVAVRDRNPKAGAAPARVKGRPVMAATNNRSDCFSLLFRSPEKLSELTSIYRLSHGALGKFDLFMTPSEDEHGQIFYEAVINHLIQ